MLDGSVGILPRAIFLSSCNFIFPKLSMVANPEALLGLVRVANWTQYRMSAARPDADAVATLEPVSKLFLSSGTCSGSWRSTLRPGIMAGIESPTLRAPAHLG